MNYLRPNFICRSVTVLSNCRTFSRIALSRVARTQTQMQLIMENTKAISNWN